VKFIEIQTEDWDDESEEEIRGLAIVAVDDIVILEIKKHTKDGVASMRPMIKFKSGSNRWVFNYSYQDLKALLTRDSNLIRTGGTV